MTINNPHTRAFWLPLELCHGSYIIAADWRRSQLSPIPEEKLSSFVHERCRSESAIVNIGDEVFKARVFVPSDVDEHAYVLVDSNNLPIHADAYDTRPWADVSSYFDHLRAALVHTESLLPDQNSYLWTEFLQPRVCLAANQRGVPERLLLDWRDIQAMPRVFLSGAPGVGKTTLLRRLAIELADSEASDTDIAIPVYVRLRHWSSTRSTDQLVRREVASIATPDVMKQLDNLAQSGRILFLFDGLDEVEAENRMSAISDIASFISRFSECRFVVSGRPGVYLHALEKEFVNWEVRPWTRSQVKEFCWHKFSSKGLPGGHFWSRLIAEPEMCELSTNPLTISLLVARHLRDGLSPHYVTEVVTSLVNVFVDEWDAIRGIRRSITAMTPLRKTAILRCLAGHIASSGRHSCSLDEFRVLAEKLNIDDEPGKVLKTLAEETGLILQAENDQWMFSHKCFQECLAASFYVDGVTAPYEAQSDGWWRSITRYISCMASNASRLLNPYLERAIDAESAKVLAEAMSQNLLIERSTISGFGLYIVAILESLMAKCHATVVDESGSTANEWKLVIDLASKEPLTHTANELCGIATAIYKTRDGVARQELAKRMTVSVSEPVVKMSEMLSIDGEMSLTVSETSTGARIHIRITGFDDGEVVQPVVVAQRR